MYSLEQFVEHAQPLKPEYNRSKKNYDLQCSVYDHGINRWWNSRLRSYSTKQEARAVTVESFYEEYVAYVKGVEQYYKLEFRVFEIGRLLRLPERTKISLYKGMAVGGHKGLSIDIPLDANDADIIRYGDYIRPIFEEYQRRLDLYYSTRKAVRDYMTSFWNQHRVPPGVEWGVLVGKYLLDSQNRVCFLESSTSQGRKKTFRRVQKDTLDLGDEFFPTYCIEPRNYCALTKDELIAYITEVRRLIKISDDNPDPSDTMKMDSFNDYTNKNV